MRALAKPGLSVICLPYVVCGQLWTVGQYLENYSALQGMSSESLCAAMFILNATEKSGGSWPFKICVEIKIDSAYPSTSSYCCAPHPTQTPSHCKAPYC